MTQGYIKLYRQAVANWTYDCKPYDKFHAWMDILLSVNHEDKKILFDGELLTVQKGQMVTSARKLSKRWGWSHETVRKFLTLLQSDAMLEIRVDSRKTVVTVVKWDFFQGEQKNRRQSVDSPLTVGATNNNEKNEKNISNSSLRSELDTRAERFTPPTLEEVSEYCRERGNRVDPQGFIDFYASKGWMVGKSPMKDWKAALRNAEKWERWDRPSGKAQPPQEKNYEEF